MECIRKDNRLTDKQADLPQMQKQDLKIYIQQNQTKRHFSTVQTNKTASALFDMPACCS